VIPSRTEAKAAPASTSSTCGRFCLPGRCEQVLTTGKIVLQKVWIFNGALMVRADRRV
jgi:hypothetical protein